MIGKKLSKETKRKISETKKGKTPKNFKEMQKLAWEQGLSKEAREKIKHKPTSLRYVTYKFMPITLESPTATIIYAGKVVLQSWTKNPFAVLIEDEQMAENQKRYFEELWKIAKR